MHFTGKERGNESGLDDFGARYYSPRLGRFMTPDWSESPEPVPYADLSNPQTLNLYSYVRDNPLSVTDPTGHCDDEDQNRCTKDAPSSAQQQNDQHQNTSKLDNDKFVNYMDQNAKNKSTGFCAMACRKGLAAGGLNTSGHPGDAKDYGPFLVKNGASVVPNKGYKPEKGDIVVFEGNKSHPYGHIEVYNGKGWVSDFKQHSMIPYRSGVPPHTVYRFPDDQ